MYSYNSFSLISSLICVISESLSHANKVTSARQNLTCAIVERACQSRILVPFSEKAALQQQFCNFQQGEICLYRSSWETRWKVCVSSFFFLFLFFSSCFKLYAIRFGSFSQEIDVADIYSAWRLNISSSLRNSCCVAELPGQCWVCSPFGTSAYDVPCDSWGFTKDAFRKQVGVKFWLKTTLSEVILNNFFQNGLSVKAACPRHMPEINRFLSFNHFVA